MQERTTVTADADDLAVLREEARRRGVSLSAVLAEAAAARAREVRSARRPRTGVGRSGAGSVTREAAERPDEPAAAHPPRG